jgi:DNA-binding transcriptional LysR family regulator
MDNVSDLAFFAMLYQKGNLSVVARELGVTPSAISKRLAQLETRLGVRLMSRTTRRSTLTDEGVIYLRSAERIISEIGELERSISSRRAAPKGLLRVNAGLGFGRKHLAPLISDFVLRYPEVQVQLHLADRLVNLSEEGFDVGVRAGAPADSRAVARKIASNRWIICGSPEYLKRRGTPAHPSELAGHDCLVLRDKDTSYGVWHFQQGSKQFSVKVHGPLSSNDNESIVQWALRGHGLINRSDWDVAEHVRAGRLKLVLEDFAMPSGDFYAIYPDRHNLSAKVAAFVNFLAERLGETPPWKRR